MPSNFPYSLDHAHPKPGEAEALAAQFQSGYTLAKNPRTHEAGTAQMQAAWDALNQFYFQAIVKYATYYSKWGNERATTEVLVSYGCEGVRRAALKYNPKRGASFSTYVFPWIRAFVRRGLQAESYLISLPSYMQDRLMRAGSDSLTTQEIAKKVGAKKRGEESYALSALKSQRELSLDDGGQGGPQGRDNGRTLSEFLACEKSHINLDAGLRRQSFYKLISGLDERWQRILEMRFIENRKLDEIGAEFGFSRERARQLIGKALEQIRPNAHILEV